MNRIAAIVSSVLVVLVVFVGLIISGSPGKQRQLRLDQQRVADLQRLSTLIEQYWQRNQRLPESLDTLVDGTRLFSVPADPETEAGYDYRVDGQRTFQLCATFLLPSENDPSQTFWNHPAGRFCFDFEAEPAIAMPR